MKKTLLFILLLVSGTYGQMSKKNGDASAEKTLNPADLKEYLNRGRNPEKSLPVRIPKIPSDNSINLDGDPDEEAWLSAAVFRDFIQTSPGDNTAPSKRTEAYLAYDEKYLYVAFKCWDEKEKIRATIVKRDDVFNEDNVHIFLDTYDDQRRAYLLGWNPLGIQADAIFTDGQGSDFSIDIVMESKGKIHDWGWSIEAKIPFESLRYRAGKGKMWGFNAARSIHRLNNEVDSWMPNNRDIAGTLIQHGKITGLNEIESERTLELIPSITISETGNRVSDKQIPAGRFVNEPVKQQLGLNLKYSITPNLTLDAAINPDYAEIEADAPVVAANQRFPIFFAEKRPFFLEGADIFQSPLFIFNSRAIIDPDLAVKLTGKIGKNTIGFLAASDNAPGNFTENERNDPNIRPFIDEFIGKNAAFAVLRLKRDLGKENNIGFFATARTFTENKNFVGGFDGQIKVSPQDTFTFQAVGTNSKKCFFDPFFDEAANSAQAQRNKETCGGNEYSRYRTGNGIGYSANYSHESDRFAYSLGAGGRSADYRADSGFTRRTDNHWGQGTLRFSTASKPENKIVRVDWFQYFGGFYSGKGRVQAFEWNTNINFSLQKNTSFSVWTGVAPQKLYEDEFGLARNSSRSGTFFGENSRDTVIQWVGGSIQS
ncbi:MAG: carbohydrate binding family 9 domain-containing protein, partial [Acidobacteria bacterium]|nr:carbohydrate binding family 9 domain-containing protein [Acidobacteriota bacterium]